MIAWWDFYGERPHARVGRRSSFLIHAALTLGDYRFDFLVHAALNLGNYRFDRLESLLERLKKNALAFLRLASIRLML
jgi:hypothetical protein